MYELYGNGQAASNEPNAFSEEVRVLVPRQKSHPHREMGHALSRLLEAERDRK
jgi:hypothetical protein